MQSSYRRLDLTVQAPFPELFTRLAEQNPQSPLVQVIQEHLDAPTDVVLYTYADVIQHARNAAANLRGRWSERQDDEDMKRKVESPRTPGSPPVMVGVLAKNGYELYVNILACALNRWTIVLISSSNSPAGVEQLLRKSNASLFLVDDDALARGRTMAQTIPGITVEAISTLNAPTAGPAPSPLGPITEEQLKKEMDLPAFCLHTSGTTGYPKLICWSHRYVLSSAKFGRDNNGSDSVPLYTPVLVHGTGAMTYLVYFLAQSNLLTFFPPSVPKLLTAADFLKFIPFIRHGIAVLPPSVMEELCLLGTRAVQIVAEELRLIFIAGAPLKTTVGDALLAAGVRFSCAYGTNEIGFLTQVRSADQKRVHWKYMQFREGYELHFIPTEDNPNLLKLIVGPGKEDCPAVINNEKPFGFATNDIWEPHPTVPNLWKHHSRKGDITILSSGKKTDNKHLEDLLLQDDHIIHVVVFGTGRLLNGVIVQPADPSITSCDFLSGIQHTIDHANSILPWWSRLVPELLIVANPDKPLSMTDKGTVRKKETLDIYHEDVESAYETLGRIPQGVADKISV